MNVWLDDSAAFTDVKNCFCPSEPTQKHDVKPAGRRHPVITRCSAAHIRALIAFVHLFFEVGGPFCTDERIVLCQNCN